MRPGLGGLTLLAAVSLVGCSPSANISDGSDLAERASASAAAQPKAGAEAASDEPSLVAEALASCRSIAESLPVEAQVGQLYMVGVSTSGLDEATRTALLSNNVGSVVLLGNSSTGSKPIRLLTAELGSLATAEVPLLIAVDQEGGAVQRLQGAGFTRIPSAHEQGGYEPGLLATEAETWGRELKDAGVDYNLAPVADVVPEDRRSSNAPIGELKRDFGSDPALVGTKSREFIEGMHRAGVLTSVKHFPGLGLVETNTDFGAARDTEVTPDSPVIEPFREAIDAGADSVMVSSAVFTKIDGDNEGVFSSPVITDLLRGELGYDGVVIADDLGAAKSVKEIEPAERGVRFIEAGGDLAINADPSLMGDMIGATLERVASDEGFAERVTESTERVLRLKASAGLVDCA